MIKQNNIDVLYDLASSSMKKSHWGRFVYYNSSELIDFYSMCSKLEDIGCNLIKEREKQLDQQLVSVFENNNADNTKIVDVLAMIIERHFEDTVSNLTYNLENITTRCDDDEDLKDCLDKNFLILSNLLEDALDLENGFSVLKRIKSVCERIEKDHGEKCCSVLYDETKKIQASFIKALKKHLNDLRDIGKKQNSIDGVDVFTIDGEKFNSLVRVEYLPFKNECTSIKDMATKFVMKVMKKRVSGRGKISTSIISNTRYNHYGNRCNNIGDNTASIRGDDYNLPYIIFGYPPNSINENSFMSANVGNINSSCNGTNMSQNASEYLSFSDFMRSFFAINPQKTHNELLFAENELAPGLLPAYILAEDRLRLIDLLVAKKLGLSVVVMNTKKVKKIVSCDDVPNKKILKNREYNY